MKKSILLLLLLLVNSTIALFSQTDNRLAKGISPIEKIAALPIPSQNTKALLAEELSKRTSGRAPKYAVNIPVNFTPQADGIWENIKGDKMVSRMKIKSSGAEAINLGFTKYNMPRGGQLFLYSSDYQEVFGPFTPADNEEHEQLWTPNIKGDEIVVEIQIPKNEFNNLDIELGFVNHAFQKFSSTALLSGSCNLDVICGAADGWGIVDPHRDIIQSVAVISTGGGTFCTGFLISNANQDCTPLFMTANHCGIGAGNAASLVTYWNFFNSTCRQPNSTASGQNGNGSLTDFNTGAIFRATNSASDFSIVELDDPVSASANAYFAGYDASGAQANSAIGIHHPSTDEKRISFENDPTQFTTYGSATPTANYTHIQVVDWDTGTTEGGSSGSPLFDQDERVIGQLHGGGAACGNNSSDWYGSLAVSWEGGGTPTTRVRDWLDPNNTGTLVNNGYYAGNCNFSVLAEPGSQEICPPTNAVYTLTVSDAFTSNVNLSITGLPTGLNASFSNNNVSPGSSVTLTISNTSNAAAGNYTFDVNGTDGVNNSTNTLAINILPSAGSAPNYTSPNNGAAGQAPFITLEWNGITGVDYNIEIATNASFSNIIETATVMGSSYNSTNTGDGLTTYFWRISANSPCGNGPFGTGWSFTTANIQCVSETAANLGLAIGPNNGNLTHSVLNIAEEAIITDVNVVGIDLTHTWINDLSITLSSPTGQQVQLMEQICDNEDNIFMSFDDQSTSPFTDIPCPPTSGLSYQPFVNLSAFNGLNAQGDWTLTIKDNANLDGGTLIGWNLQMCFEEASVSELIATAEVTENNECFGEEEGVITVSAMAGTPPYTYSIDGSNFQTDAFFEELGAGTYTVMVMDAAGMSLTINNLMVSHPSAVFASVSVNQNDATINASGGTPAYTYSTNGSNFQSSNTFENLANGDYTAFIEDANGCTVEENFTIAVNPVTLSAQITQSMLCFDDNNAVITATAGGGQNPYTFTITGGLSQDNGVFENLTAGTYQITVEDDNGFSQTTAPIIINNPIQLSIAANVNDSDMTASATGGTGVLMYSIDGINYQTDALFNDLANGNYTLFVQDTNGCIAEMNFTIAVNNLAVNTTFDQISCFNDANGSITVNASGGSTPYSYSLNGATAQSSNIFGSLGEGIYEVTVMDADGFTQITNSITLTNPEELALTVLVDEDEITAFGNGGTGNFQYSINDSSFSSNNVFSNLTNGLYTVFVQDENGCIATQEITIAVNNLSVSAQSTDIICNGDNNGTLTASAGGGQEPYMYSIDGTNFQASNVFDNLNAGTYEITVQDADGFSQLTNPVAIGEPTAITASASINSDEITITANGGTGTLQYSIDGTNYQNSNIFSGLDNGTYTISVQDTNGCIVTTTGIVAVNGLVVSAQSTDIICNGDNNGTLTASAGGGQEPYMYSIDGTNFQASNVFDNLNAGTYEITVQDADGFSQLTNPVAIGEPTAITASASINSDEITITANGGTGTLQYSIDGTNYQNSNIFSGLDNGTYTISVQDTNGCIVTTTGTISVNSLTIITEAKNISCHDANDGMITAFIDGGQEPYMYSLDGENFQTSALFDNLSAGDYTITAQDATGISIISSSISIINPESLTVSITVEDDIIVATGNGGIPDYLFSLDGENYQETSIFDDLPNGTYTVYIIDENGCIDTAETIISANNVSGMTSISSQISCFGDSNGAISVTALSGTEPFQFSIDGGTTYQTDNYFGGLSTGEYTFMILDNEGFTFTTNTITLLQPTELQANSSIIDNSITVIAEGGIAPYSYSINGSDFSMDNVFEGLINGTYDIITQDFNGCEVFLTEIINVNTMSVSVTIEANISCFNEEDGAIIVSVMGGTPPFMYSIDGENFQESNTFMNLPAGSYAFTVTDAQGATTETTAIFLTNPEQLFVNASTTENSATLVGIGGTTDYLYSLDGETFQTSGDFLDLVNGNYIGYVQDANACIAETSFSIMSSELFAAAEVTQNIDCFGDKVGIIEINASGGIAPYTYSIEGFSYQMSNVFTELSAGTYSCYAQDANGTIYETASVTITESELLILNAQGISSSIIASAEGGTTPYQFSIDGDNFQDSGTFNDLPDGEYSVTVMDALACTETLMIVIDLVDTDNIINNLNFNIYPNPSLGSFSIELENEIRGDLTISLFNIIGQQLFIGTTSKESERMTYSLSDLELAGGTYEVLVHAGDYIGMKKVVVIR